MLLRVLWDRHTPFHLPNYNCIVSLSLPSHLSPSISIPCVIFLHFILGLDWTPPLVVRQSYNVVTIRYILRSFENLAAELLNMAWGQYSPAARFSTNLTIYRILVVTWISYDYLTMILRCATIRFVVRHSKFTKHVVAYLTTILRSAGVTIS